MRRSGVFHRGVVWLSVVAVAILGVLAARDAVAQGAGDLVVSPTRVVLEGRERSAQISLSNRGSEVATFRISLITMHMDENGGLNEVERGTNGIQDANDLIRYAPRQIEIAPGAAQVVRLSVRKPSDLADGEYRSHMFFRAVPDETAGRSVTDDTDLEEGELRIQLIPVYGITIPVIVRQGDLSAEASLSGVAVLPEDADGPQRISLTMGRSGDRSLFGDLTATYTPSSGGEPLVVAQISRLGLYTPNATRHVVMPVRMPEGTALGQGTLSLEYRAVEEDGGELQAQTSISLP